MPRSPDLVGLTVLALLSVKASHPYEMHRLILDTHKDYVTGLPRSLYHAVDRLAGDELIVPVETSREGRRPERTVYRLSDEGRAELGTRLRRLLAEPGQDRRHFLAAISLIGCLSEPDAERALLTRAAALESAVFACDAHLRSLEESGLPRLLLLELECERALRGAELDWVRSVLERLGTGELSWKDRPGFDMMGASDEEDPAV
ncbi:PadR family transcriptional regulator [Streptosporangium carneum]|uniref:PadR family transcriptional regulator n=1 Tax=Streptosporangium carneum TaxID=47481 RepID=A0A9W6HW16_9ACTN|nr:PadR family transcriptional regulator [Streptosporangium carneum]GLK07102.1 PadR family transcriptional regulator [Streptosporangium carneum]